MTTQGNFHATRGVSNSFFALSDILACSQVCAMEFPDGCINPIPHSRTILHKYIATALSKR